MLGEEGREDWASGKRKLDVSNLILKSFSAFSHVEYQPRVYNLHERHPNTVANSCLVLALQ